MPEVVQSQLVECTRMTFDKVKPQQGGWPCQVVKTYQCRGEKIKAKVTPGDRRSKEGC